MKKSILLLIGLTALSFGCSSEEIPAAHKGRIFSKTGALAFYRGEVGFTGPILGPGTHYTGMYNDLKVVDCSQETKKETMPSLTKDSVQFSLDVYTRYSINCDDDKSVESVLNKIRPIAIPETVTPPSQAGAQPTVTPRGPDNVVNAFQLYEGIIRPALGEAVRESVSSFIANEVNANREVIFKNIKESVLKQITDKKPQLVNIIELNLSNLDFPDELDKANVARAEQAVLKDKAIAERDRVDAEVETANKRKALVTSESNNEAARIDALGSAYRRNPEYVQLESIRVAAEKGNLIVAQPGTGLIIQHK